MKGYQVKVTRLDTGETFPSIRAAAKALYLDERYLSSSIVKKKGFAGGIPLKFEETEVMSGALGRPTTKIQRLDTGEIFESVGAAARALECGETTIFEALRYQRPCKGIWIRKL